MANMTTLNTTPQDRRLFAKIARRYDFLNHLFSLNIDQAWRRRLVQLAEAQPGDKILDVCVGTGDIAIRFARGNGVGHITGVDLTDEMLRIARRKAEANKIASKITLLKGDGLNLPFSDNSFDIVSIGFGLRNLGHPQRGISEMVRVLRPDGRLLILEFSPPEDGLVGRLYNLYLNTVIRAVGGIISGSAEAYRYLSTIKRWDSLYIQGAKTKVRWGLTGKRAVECPQFKSATWTQPLRTSWEPAVTWVNRKRQTSGGKEESTGPGACMRRDYG
jgi:demethylmenaquinone methyltransferase/2-methoxy-6-polyprenyl-1,4-benzoquinol methylase